MKCTRSVKQHELHDQTPEGWLTLTRTSRLWVTTSTRPLSGTITTSVPHRAGDCSAWALTVTLTGPAETDRKRTPQFREGNFFFFLYTLAFIYKFQNRPRTEAERIHLKVFLPLAQRHDEYGSLKGLRMKFEEGAGIILTCQWNHIRAYFSKDKGIFFPPLWIPLGVWYWHAPFSGRSLCASNLAGFKPVRDS